MSGYPGASRPVGAAGSFLVIGAPLRGRATTGREVTARGGGGGGGDEAVGSRTGLCGN